MKKIRYTFSGHDSFYCKSMWLKKGYDFVSEDLSFTSPDAVLHLGVGRNMVSSIRFWMRALGLLDEDSLTEVSHYLFNDDNGVDPYIEDLGTIWLLHYLLIKTNVSSIYKLFFTEFQKERATGFTRDNLTQFLKRKTLESDYPKSYNKNTVNRDIGVLLKNYTTPELNKANEDFSALFIELDLIRPNEDRKSYYFNVQGKLSVDPVLFLYAIVDSYIDDLVISFEMLVDLAIVFCLTNAELIDILTKLTQMFPKHLRYSDDAGIKQLFISDQFDKQEILNSYYNR